MSANLALSGISRECKKCHEIRAIESFSPYGNTADNTRRRTCRVCRGQKELPKFRQLSPEELKPVKSPSTLDIAWAAGIYEGEGNCTPIIYKDGHRKPSLRVSVCQKSPEILYKLRDMFGGSVYERQGIKTKASKSGFTDICTWYVYADRAYGIALTLFSFLSCRRREQIKKALEVCYSI